MSMHPMEESILQVEYPSYAWKGQPSPGLLPIDAKLLREFWTLKEAVLPPASAIPQKGSVQDASYWAPAQLHQARLNRSVSAQEFYTDSKERCVRAGLSGKKGDARVRLGRHSAAAVFSSGLPSPAPCGDTARIPATSASGFLQGLYAIHTSLPTPATAAAACCTQSASSQSLSLQGRPRNCDGEAAEGGGGQEPAWEGAAESKQHGGRSGEAMDRRVRGGRLLRTQSKDPNFMSVLSLLDAVGAAAGPQTPGSDSSAATCPAPLTGELSFGSGGGATAPLGQTLGTSLSRLYSLDSATLHNLDRALGGALEHPSLGGALEHPSLGDTLSPVQLGPGTSSAPPPGGLGGRIYKVRPLGAAASSLSLHSACPLGASFSRCNSTLFDFAEEQASLAAVQQGLEAASLGGAGGGSAVDFLSLLSRNNSMGGGGYGGGYGGSYQSSAAGSLTASPNVQQPHVSLAALLGAAAATSRASSGGGAGLSGGGSVVAAAAAAAAAAGCSMPLHSSMPSAMGRQGRALAAPDMRFFPFSSPEDFYMAATVLLDAKLPGVLAGDAAVSPPAAGGGACE